MRCPYCKDKILKNAKIVDVEVDYCPKCHGLWLDRGELDKIFENADGIFKKL